MSKHEKINLLEVKNVLARRKLIHFATAVKKNYDVTQFHDAYASVLDDFANGKIKKLMVFAPPQHGKSQMCSVYLPATILGRKPTAKVSISSYNSNFSSKFNREIQRLISSPEYAAIYPDTKLGSANISTSSRGILRNANEFEIVKYFGSLKSVGIGGPLTGNAIDYGIIDDPYKDAAAAFSEAYESYLRDWYDMVFKTRLHNDSQQLITLTRWKENDLIDYILSKENDWTIVKFEAIKETNDNPLDKRQIGEPLYGKRHELKKLEEVRKNNPDVFNAMYQQNPTTRGGGLIKSAWFGKETIGNLQRRATQKGESLVWNFSLDGAYTKNTQNSATACMAWCYFESCLYIRDVYREWKTISELVAELPEFLLKNGYKRTSALYVEPKASGLDIIDMLKVYKSINALQSKLISQDKISNVNDISFFLQAQRCVILDTFDSSKFTKECEAFPKAKHNDQVDTLCMAVTQAQENYENMQYHN